MRTDKPYRQLTGLSSTDSARVPGDLLEIGDRFACAQQKDPPGRSQLDSPAASFKQGNPDILFQKLDLGANSRLRNMQRSRCTGETEFFCYRYKITKVTEFHGADLYGRTYSPPFPGDRPPLEVGRPHETENKVRLSLQGSLDPKKTLQNSITADFTESRVAELATLRADGSFRPHKLSPTLATICEFTIKP
jgi:hypothetical protein